MRTRGISFLRIGKDFEVSHRSSVHSAPSLTATVFEVKE
ncbi:hypothetical protein IC007_2305 [Sulfuracidifex tepidarius]|uniref:Uncharacterized protein n=1 Tax=Sulfuracidifex tepidarius TaxID=1294262 RepID=A0A510E5F0_9CREN|nr:hypothetical protein IC007_2305 [Sulfuracidifex tepidarius]